MTIILRPNEGFLGIFLSIIAFSTLAKDRTVAAPHTNCYNYTINKTAHEQKRGFMSSTNPFNSVDSNNRSTVRKSRATANPSLIGMTEMNPQRP